MQVDEELKRQKDEKEREELKRRKDEYLDETELVHSRHVFTSGMTEWNFEESFSPDWISHSTTRTYNNSS